MRVACSTSFSGRPEKSNNNIIPVAAAKIPSLVLTAGSAQTLFLEILVNNFRHVTALSE
jgi:hypothetical protein